jgi:hypothetical protein
MVAALERQAVRVVGDLDDLRVPGAGTDGGGTTTPPVPSAEEQLDAAVDAIAGLLQERARLARRARRPRSGRRGAARW